MIRRVFAILAVMASLGAPAGIQPASASHVAYNIYELPATPLNASPDLRELSGHITMLITFQPNCAWCPLQFKAAQEFQRTRAPWLQIAAVSHNGSIPALLHELDRYQTPFPAYQSSPALLEALEFTPGTPCVYLIGEDGHLGQISCGRKTPDELVRFLMGQSDR